MLPELLANLAGRPSALRLRSCGEATWLTEGWLSELTGLVPCVMLAEDLGVHTDRVERLAQLGVRIEEATAFQTQRDPLASSSHAGPPWLAGDWYLHISARPNAAQAASRQNALILMQRVAQDADTLELEEVFRQDAFLAYQLLRMVNSPAVGIRREITSFRQAILILGRQSLKRWLNLLLFAARDDDPRSAMLMARVVMRSRGMELLAERAGLDRTDQDQVFMAGMFSMLGILMGQPLPDILLSIRISKELEAALLQRQGPIGELLLGWERIESFDCQQALETFDRFSIPPHEASALLAEAAGWMFQLIRGPMNDD